MLSPFSPLIAHYLLFSGSFLFCLLLTGLLISHLHHNITPASSVGSTGGPTEGSTGNVSQIPVFAAAPLGGMLFALTVSGGWMAFSRAGDAHGWALLASGFLAGAVLLFFSQFGMVSFSRPRLIAGVNLSLISLMVVLVTIITVLQLPQDTLVFHGVFSLMIDRIVASLLVISIALLFCQADQVEGTGVLFLGLTGLGLIGLAIGIYGIASLSVILGDNLTLESSAPAWPMGWFGISLVLLGIAGGNLFWMTKGFSFYIGGGGRVALGVILGFLLLHLTLLTSVWVTLLLLFLPLSRYFVVPFYRRCYGRIFKPDDPQNTPQQAKVDIDLRLWSPPLNDFPSGLIVSLVWHFGGYIILSSLAFYFPLISLAMACVLGGAILALSRR